MRRIPLFSPLALFPKESRRGQGFVPNKGIRTQPAVPDRLKDAMAMVGVDTHVVDSEKYHVSEDRRSSMLSGILSSTQHLRSRDKLDRLRLALDKVRHNPRNNPEWRDVYMFFRTTEMCTEVERNATDVFEKGKKLWIEMQVCEEQRIPPLCRLPNGMLVLPIFSLEEYQDGYFSHVDKFQSTWFPFPRGGSQWEEFCKLEFPVCCTGELQHHCAFATMAYPYQFALLLNPCQKESKFITYPEMVELAKIRRLPAKERNVEIYRTGDDGVVRPIFDEHLLMTFNTENLPLERIPSEEVEACMKGRPPIPPLSQMELHHLLYPYREISSVYIRTVDQPRWRQMLGGNEKLTRIDVVVEGETKPDPSFLEHLQNWSFMKEFNSDVHIELTNQVPSAEAGQQYMQVYHFGDGEMLRRLVNNTGPTLLDSLGYFDEFDDGPGGKFFATEKSKYW